MQCVSWEAGEVTAGISVRGSLSRGFFCLLGDPDTPGPAPRISLHSSNPPRVVAGQVSEAFPFWVRPKEARRFLVLAAPHDKHAEDPRFLIRISTHNPETFGGRGFWRATTGKTNTLAAGIAHYTDVRGRKAVASHGLIILETMQVLRVRSEGSDTHWAVREVDGTVTSTPWEQYQAALYLEKG